MADYKNIKGFNIQYLDSDPPNPIEGQMWFNSTTQTLKGQAAGGVAAGTWSSGGNLNQSRWITSGAGRGYTPSASAALIIGGRTAPGAYVGSTELYNGSSWTELNDLNTSRDQLGSSGTSTSAITAGGYNDTIPVAVVASSESWNGTSWTSTPSLNQARYSPGSSGESNTSALRFGGVNGPTRAETESWNGSAWTEVNDLNTARGGRAGVGTQTAALAISGGNILNVEQWNGTSWTEIADVLTAQGDGVGAGSVSEAIVYGGESPAPYAGTQYYNGTSWAEVGDLGVNRDFGGGGGLTASVAIMAGGTPPVTNATEEWLAPTGPVTKTFTTS
jgi:hypothetical protein